MFPETVAPRAKRLHADARNFLMDALSFNLTYEMVGFINSFLSNTGLWLNNMPCKSEVLRLMREVVTIVPCLDEDWITTILSTTDQCDLHIFNWTTSRPLLIWIGAADWLLVKDRDVYLVNAEDNPIDEDSKVPWLDPRGNWLYHDCPAKKFNRPWWNSLIRDISSLKTDDNSNDVDYKEMVEKAFKTIADNTPAPQDREMRSALQLAYYVLFIDRLGHSIEW